MPKFSAKNRLLKFALLGKRRSWTNRLAVLLTIAAVASGFATYGALTETPPFGNDPDTVIWLLNVDLILLLLLGVLVARRIAGLWSGRRRGLAGAKLHVRLVFIFSLLTAAPAIIMTIFAAVFLNFGVHSWFSERVSTAVNESQAVAEAYLAEHIQVIRADTLAMAQDLDRQINLLVDNPDAFHKLVETQSIIRNLPEVIVFDISGTVLSSSPTTKMLEIESVPKAVLEKAERGEVPIMTGEDDDRVRALIRMNGLKNGYLFVGRMVDQRVLSHLADTRKASSEYKMLEQQSSSLQVKVSMIFIVVALLLMFAAIWFGLIFSRQLIVPISSLIAAADRVRAGDLTARVPERGNEDEFDILARAFNRMTSQIQEQRDELITANRQLDERRRFTETVLAGVSSGIVGVDRNGRITIANSTACDLFGVENADFVTSYIVDFLPEVDALLHEAESKPRKVAQAEIAFLQDDVKRTLLVRVAIETIGEEEYGAVLTFDDITELLSAQRKAAWADVARRIAHEIKNPLTPIQLAAERLKRKYMDQITTDREIFAQCTDTIIHHVGDIGNMVNEFSAFARMPEPSMKEDNLNRHLRAMLVMQQQAHPDITFTLNNVARDGARLMARFDAQQIRQAFTNILQNAIESISEAGDNGDSTADSKQGRIDILVASRPETDELVIAVTDNGPGFSEKEDLSRLTEPYVTHKIKGTGLGLAIVKKIMEDHNGRVVIGAPEWLKSIEEWQDLGGATVSLILPVDRVEQDNAPQLEEAKAAS